MTSGFIFATPEERRLLEEMVGLRIRLEILDEVQGPERIGMIARLDELEKMMRSAGLLGEVDASVSVRRSEAVVAQPVMPASIEPE